MRKESSVITHRVTVGMLVVNIRIEDGKMAEFSTAMREQKNPPDPTPLELYNAGQDLQRAAVDLGYRAKRGPSVEQMRVDLLDAVKEGLWFPRPPGNYEGSPEEFIDIMSDGGVERKWRQICGERGEAK